MDIKVNSRKEIKEAVDLAFKQDSQVRSYIAPKAAKTCRLQIFTQTILEFGKVT